MKYFSLAQQKTIFIIALFLIFIISIRFYHTTHIPQYVVHKEIAIEVSGDVKRPGIYLFNSQPTLGEAIQMAGGFKEAVFFDPSLSQEILESGTLVRVQKESPREMKIKIEKMEAQKLILFSIGLDLNRVSSKDLCLIPEIGEAIAKEIIFYREKIGRFRSVEELKNVKGIGEKKYQLIKNYFSTTNAKQNHRY